MAGRIEALEVLLGAARHLAGAPPAGRATAASAAGWGFPSRGLRGRRLVLCAKGGGGRPPEAREKDRNCVFLRRCGTGGGAGGGTAADDGVSPVVTPSEVKRPALGFGALRVQRGEGGEGGEEEMHPFQLLPAAPFVNSGYLATCSGRSPLHPRPRPLL